MRNLFENIKFSRYSYSDEELENLVDENNMPVEFTSNVNNIIVFDGATVQEANVKMFHFMEILNNLKINPYYSHIVKDSDYKLVYSIFYNTKSPQLIIKTETLFTFLKGFVLGYSFE